MSSVTGDYCFNGTGTLPDGVTPNRTAADPHHFAILAVANSPEYHQQSNGIHPSNYHDRGAGYGITRIDRNTRKITFECWPIHPDPEFPSTGGQFAGWPLTIRQTDNDGRAPTGHLPLIDTHWRDKPVIRVFDESTGELVHALRIRGTRCRPPVYDNGRTYRVEIAYDDASLSETRTGQTAAPAGSPAIRMFRAVQPSIVRGSASTLEWDVASPAMLTIDQGLGNVLSETVDGIGRIDVKPETDTTYTLTLNGTLKARTSIRVFAGRTLWDAVHFTPAELASPAVAGGDADPDDDGFTNDREFLFQTNPRGSSSFPVLRGGVVDEAGMPRVEFSSSCPLDVAAGFFIVESSTDLRNWTKLPSNSLSEISRDAQPATGTSRITIRVEDPVPRSGLRIFYRAGWDLR